MSKFTDYIKKSGARNPSEPEPPVWRGPTEDGITFSLLSRFLVCRRRFGVHVMEGLVSQDWFNHRIEYGNMWHVCEEALASNNAKSKTKVSTKNPPRPWEQPLKDYAISLCKRYPTQQEQVDWWYNVCRVQFPLYVQWWSKHPDTMTKVNLYQEEKFRVPYELPSGRIVTLRGKWDSNDLTGKGVGKGIYIQENKTKGDIVEQQLRRQLTFDLQTMFYAIAFVEWQDLDDYGEPIRTPSAVEANFKGIRYNVIRRPLSGGKGNIRQHQATSKKPAETKEEFFNRLGEIIAGAYGSEWDLPQDEHYFFMRWQVEISDIDIENFRNQCLDPILENLCDWWDESYTNVMGKHPPGMEVLPSYRTPMNWQHPFGVYNVLDEGGSSELDEYLATGSRVGLTKTNDLFPELSR